MRNIEAAYRGGRPDSKTAATVVMASRANPVPYCHHHRASVVAYIRDHRSFLSLPWFLVPGYRATGKRAE